MSSISLLFIFNFIQENNKQNINIGKGVTISKTNKIRLGKRDKTQ